MYKKDLHLVLAFCLLLFCSVVFGDAIVINVKNPPYNAKGDDKTNDTDAIQNAINQNQGKTILLKDGVFAVTSGVTISANTVLMGQNATLKSIAPTYGLLTINSGTKVSGLVIDGNNTTAIAIKIANGSKDVTIDNSVIKNIYYPSSHNTGVFSWPGGCDGIAISSTSISGINCDSRMASRGIYLNDCNNIVINDCNVFDVNSPTDGDCIYISMPIDGDAWADCNIVILNSRFSDFSKRGIKLQCSEATVKNNVIKISDSCQRTGIEFFGKSTLIHDNKIYIEKGIAGIIGTGKHKIDKSEIKNNIIILDPDGRNLRHLGSSTGGIRLGHANGVTITGNTIDAYRGLFWHGVSNSVFTGNILDVNVVADGYEYSNNNTFQTE